MSNSFAAAHTALARMYRLFGQIRTEHRSTAEVDMRDVGLRLGGVPMHDQAYAHGQRARHRHLVGIHQRGVGEADFARCNRRELGMQVDRCRKPDAGYIRRDNPVGFDHRLEHGRGRLDDGFTGVARTGNRATDSTTGYRH